jgi:MoxR-like ATPase
MQQQPPPNPTDLADAREALARLEEAVNRAVLGQRQVVREVVVALAAAGHVLLEGLPGMGKTLLVRAIAQAVGGRYARVQFTPDLMPSDITGHAIFDMKSEQFRIRRGPVFCNILLGDEINRAPAKTQAADAGGHAGAAGHRRGAIPRAAAPFMVLATQNPIEQEGTYPLPAAQLDRFLVKSYIHYPSEEDELRVVRQVTAGAVGDALDVSAVSQVLEPEACWRCSAAPRR